MKKLALTVLTLTLGFGAACSASDVASLDSASACLKAATAQMDLLDAQSQHRSDTSLFVSKASNAQATCDKAKVHELDVKAKAN